MSNGFQGELHLFLFVYIYKYCCNWDLKKRSKYYTQTFQDFVFYDTSNQILCQLWACGHVLFHMFYRKIKKYF